jgi:hypothetical protein
MVLTSDIQDQKFFAELHYATAGQVDLAKLTKHGS